MDIFKKLRYIHLDILEQLNIVSVFVISKKFLQMNQKLKLDIKSQFFY